jgi:prevent-host-death family protein
MPDVGVRELKTNASEIIRNVRDRRTRYIITYRGRPVGLLLPLDDIAPTSLPSAGQPQDSAWETLTRLGEEIGRGWRSSQTSTEILSEMRR